MYIGVQRFTQLNNGSRNVELVTAPRQAIDELVRD
jgi:hypothetical protein